MNRFTALFSVLIMALMLVVNTMDAGQCQATTKKGAQCKRSAASGSSYCWQHGGRESTSPAKPATEQAKPDATKETTVEKQSTKETSSGQCQATTKKGKQCSRKAKNGGSYCWQHGG